MARQSRQSSGTGIYHVMMRGINHQNIFEEQEDYYQFLTTLDVMAQSYEPDGTPFWKKLCPLCLIKGKTGATNSSAFQQLPDETKRSMLIELKGRRASLRQLERLTGIGKSMIYRM